MLFKTKQNQQERLKHSHKILYENQSRSNGQCMKLSMNPVYEQFRKCADSDESYSSTNTCLETLESDPNTVYSCQNCRSIHRPACNNSVHHADCQTFRKRYPEYLTPQQVIFLAFFIFL